MTDLRKIFRPFVLIAGMLAAWQVPALAQAKQKTFSKTYTVSPGATVSINNQFGNVTIHSWEKNQVKADVKIIVNQGNENQAQELLSSIDIIEDASADHVSLRTSIGKNKLKDKGNSSMQINYDVYMPHAVALNLTNKFGDTSLPDLQGNTEIRQFFGNLQTGDLTGDENELFVEFSEGSTRIGTVKNLEADFRFSNISIADLSGQAEINAQHCGKFLLGAGASLAGLELDVQYSDVAIELDDNFSGKFDVSTNFGDFRYGNRVSLNAPAGDDDDRGPKFKFNYTGRIDQGGEPMLNIESSFSTVTFR